MTSKIKGAPICAGEASPLRVATGGNANWSSESVAAARPPAQIHGAISSLVLRKSRRPAGAPNGAQNRNLSLTHIGHFFITNPRASLRSDNCPISIGIGVRYGLEQVSDIVGIRNKAPNTCRDSVGGGYDQFVPKSTSTLHSGNLSKSECPVIWSTRRLRFSSDNVNGATSSQVNPNCWSSEQEKVTARAARISSRQRGISRRARKRPEPKV